MASGTDELVRLQDLLSVIFPLIRPIKVHRQSFSLLSLRIDVLGHLVEELLEEDAPVLSSQSVAAFQALNRSLQKTKTLVQQCSKWSRIYLLLQGDFVVNQLKALCSDLDRCLQVIPLVQLQVSDDVCDQIERMSASISTMKFEVGERERQLSFKLRQLLDGPRQELRISHELLSEFRKQLGLKSFGSWRREEAALKQHQDDARADQDVMEEQYIQGILFLLEEVEGTDMAEEGSPFRLPGSVSSQGESFSSDGRMTEDWVNDRGQQASNTELGNSRGPADIPGPQEQVYLDGRSSLKGEDFRKDDRFDHVHTWPNSSPSEGSLLSDSMIHANSGFATSRARRGEREQDQMEPPGRGDAQAGSIVRSRRPAYVPQSMSMRKNQRKHASSVQEPQTPSGEIRPLPTLEEVQDMVQMLHHQSNPELQRRVIEELRLLTKVHDEARKVVAAAGGIHPVLQLLDSSDDRVVEDSVAVVLNLSLRKDNKESIVAAGSLPRLVQVLTTGRMAAREIAAATLHSLSLVDDSKTPITEAGAIPALVKLLQEAGPTGQRDAIVALYNLSLNSANRLAIVRAGAVSPLVKLMIDLGAVPDKGYVGLVEKIVALLTSLVVIPEGRDELVKEGGIPELVAILEAGSWPARESATCILLYLCKNNKDHRNQVLQEVVIPPLIVVAQSQSSSTRGKEKARVLLKFFRESRQTF